MFPNTEYIKTLVNGLKTVFLKKEDLMQSKYLPEHLQFGEPAIMNGDFMNWDGNTEGLPSVGFFFKVSDIVPTMSDFANGCTITYRFLNDGSTRTQVLSTSSGITENSNGSIDLDGIVLVVPESAAFNGYEAGLYFFKNVSIYTASLVIPGYSGFGFETFKPIDEKYLPDTVQTKITGTAGQFVVIGDDGNPTTVSLTNVSEVGA